MLNNLYWGLPFRWIGSFLKILLKEQSGYGSTSRPYFGVIHFRHMVNWESYFKKAIKFCFIPIFDTDVMIGEIVCNLFCRSTSVVAGSLGIFLTVETDCLSQVTYLTDFDYSLIIFRVSPNLHTVLSLSPKIILYLPSILILFFRWRAPNATVN